MAFDFDKINESPHLLDILIQMEDVLDSFDIYVFKNWMKGEIIEGPTVRRYWFDLTLRYKLDDMPDPRGAMRLIKHSVRVDYNKVTVEDEKGKDPGHANHWHIKISIPKRLISDLNADELAFYDEDDVEIEDIQDAQNVGVNDDTDVDGSADEMFDDQPGADGQSADQPPNEDEK